MPAPAGPAGGRLSPRSPGAPGPARPPRAARTAPGRCRLRPATARPPAGCQTGPSRPAGPSYRTRPGHTPGSAAAPALHRAPPPGAGGARSPAAGGARAAWWPAGHPARTRQPRAGPPQTAQSSATHPRRARRQPASPPGEPIVSPARLASRAGRGCGCHPQPAAISLLLPAVSALRAPIVGPAGWPAGPALAAAVPARSCLTPLREIPPAWAPSGDAKPRDRS